MAQSEMELQSELPPNRSQRSRVRWRIVRRPNGIKSAENVCLITRRRDFVYVFGDELRARILYTAILKKKLHDLGGVERDGGAKWRQAQLCKLNVKWKNEKLLISISTDNSTRLIMKSGSKC